jgi:mono/diheme cytochrome c family protein
MPNRLLFSVVAVAALAAGAAYWAQRERQPEPEELWAQVDKYCVDCHNRDDLTADIAFDKLSPSDVTHEPEIFEAAIRKLRGNQMPPPGSDQPPAPLRAALVHWLEDTLDRAAEENPNPGRIALHRLNRTEYANAIDDLFGLKIDVAALLPKDDESDGFDNVANVLKVSPSFLEQYIGAANVVSEMAVGNAAAKMDSRVFYAEPGTNQNFHRVGMPLGTRGGMLVEHFFPADGTYTITLGGLARARYVEGLEYRHTLIVAVDGKQVYANTIGGPEDLANVDTRQAAAVAEINSRFERIRVPVTAGPHKVAATFVARTLSESDAVLQPFIPGGGEVGIIEGEESPLKVERLQIDGPIDPTGLSDTPSRKRIFICRPASEADELPCAKRIVAHLTRQAFRRPVTDADLETPLQFFATGRQAGGPGIAGFENGVRNAIMIVLASPEFLYRAGAPPPDRAPGSAYAIDDYELASRLSFFLWSRLPDEELLALAEAGKLRNDDVLANQVKRMLADPRAESLVTNFAAQWLDVRGVPDIQPDPVLFAEFNPDLGDAFATELELFLRSVLLEDRSVLELLRSDTTFVNERLALHYGIGNVRGDTFRRIRLADENRFGLLGKGGILMATSYPNRTAPVLRGAWILEAITGTPPAAPPPNVEAFPENEEGVAPRTVRERLEKHRENPSCNGCHGVMDPLGFALENFDAIGAWRTKDRETATAIDSSGQLADGRMVNGPKDLRDALLADPDQFVQTLTMKLMTYGLGRGIEYYDMPAVRKVVRAAARDGYKFSSVLTAIAQSEPFRFSTIPGAEGELEAHAAASSAPRPGQ